MILQSILADDTRRMGLTLGTPVASARTMLNGFDLSSEMKIVNDAAAKLVLAGLWLYFDHFEQAHAIAQDIATPEGSYWHAIQHRREPDASNAKYWFRRVGKHPIHTALVQEAARIENAPARDWDAFGFVDRCERARGDQALIETQHAEWRLLMDYCLNLATTGDPV